MKKLKEVFDMRHGREVTKELTIPDDLPDAVLMDLYWSSMPTDDQFMTQELMDDLIAKLLQRYNPGVERRSIRITPETE